MTVYFDPVGNSADKAMLPKSIQTHPELANLAAFAEASVIGYYTANPSYYLYTTFLTFVQPTWGTIGISTQFGLVPRSERGMGEPITNTGAPSGAVTPDVIVFL